MYQIWVDDQFPTLGADYEAKWAAKIRSIGLKKRGIWAWSSFPYSIPKQGWKIHVSSLPCNVHKTVEVIFEAANELNFAYKVFGSISDYMMESCAIGHSYPQKGKFATVYPQDYEHFLKISAEIGRNLKGIEAYKIPFDKNFPNTPVFYRYGCMSRVDGHVLDHNGDLIQDDRSKYKPDFVHDPLACHIEAELDETSRPSTNSPSFFTNFKVEKVLNQRGRGGNYLASSKYTGGKFFVKEGRRLGEHDQYGRTGITRIENEWTFLKYLKDHDIGVVEPIHFSRVREFCYLVLPFVETENPLKIAYDRRETVAEKIIQIVLDTHDTGVVLGDIKLENFLVYDGSVALCDLETAAHQSWDRISPGGTLAYLPRNKKLFGKQRDLYSLAVLVLFLLNGVDATKRFKHGFSLKSLLSKTPAGLRRDLQKWLEA